MFNKASDTLSDYYYFQADIKGNSSVPDMSGTARFYPWLDGTMVEIELTGMPTRNEPFAVHIHEGAMRARGIHKRRNAFEKHGCRT